MTKVEIKYYDFTPGNQPGDCGWIDSFVVEDEDKAWHRIINNCGGVFQSSWKNELLEIPEIDGNTIRLVLNSCGRTINTKEVEQFIFTGVKYPRHKSVSGLTIPYTRR